MSNLVAKPHTSILLLNDRACLVCLCGMVVVYVVLSFKFEYDNGRMAERNKTLTPSAQVTQE